jgi:cytochrome b pre-mRNA-processing protein 3
MSLLSSLLRRRDPRERLRPLYEAVVARGRAPHWYLDGAVPDTIDGRFDMIAAILAVVLLRLERDEAAQDSVWLTETFIADMDGQLRQIGIGDLVVGKQLGKMMGALGGRLGAYRAAFAREADLREALVRNLYRGAPPAPEAVDHVATRLADFARTVDATARDRLLGGWLPE